MNVGFCNIIFITLYISFISRLLYGYFVTSYYVLEYYFFQEFAPLTMNADKST